jgi:hypothetical protein
MTIKFLSGRQPQAQWMPRHARVGEVIGQRDVDRPGRGGHQSGGNAILPTRAPGSFKRMVAGVRSVPPDGSCDQLKPPNPLRPSRAIGTRRMTRVQQHAVRSGERHAQHHCRLPSTRLPDIAGDRLGLKRSILTTEPMGRRVEVERQYALLGLRTDVGATHLADGERRAVDHFAIGMKLENQRVSPRTATEPMPLDLRPRRRRSLP